MLTPRENTSVRTDQNLKARTNVQKTIPIEDENVDIAPIWGEQVWVRISHPHVPACSNPGIRVDVNSQFAIDGVSYVKAHMVPISMRYTGVE